MTSENGFEGVRPGEGGSGVFPTRYLVWFDEESGEALEVEVLGAVAGAWVEDLLAQGFVVLEGPEGRAARRRCRIELSGLQG